MENKKLKIDICLGQRQGLELPLKTFIPGEKHNFFFICHILQEEYQSIEFN